MKKLFPLLIFLLYSSFSFAQNEKEKLEVKREREKIYSEFRKNKSELYEKYVGKYKPVTEKQKNKTEEKKLDSLSRLDYEKYRNELQLCEIKKLESLKQLLKKINDQHPLIGRTVVYLKDNPEEVKNVDKAKANPDYADFEFIGLTQDENTTYVIQFDHIKSIRQDFVNYFDSSYFDSEESVLSAKISFILDSDGNIKRLKPLQGSDEFSYFCAISLYEASKYYLPGTYKGKSILTRYALPIKMNFE